jgi:hypothetical protein
VICACHGAEFDVRRGPGPSGHGAAAGVPRSRVG